MRDFSLSTIALCMLVSRLAGEEPKGPLIWPKGARPDSIKIAEVDQLDIGPGKAVDVVGEFGDPAHTGIALLNVKLLAVELPSTGHKVDRVSLALTPAQSEIVRLLKSRGELRIKVYERGRSKPNLVPSRAAERHGFGIDLSKGYLALSIKIAPVDRLPDGFLLMQPLDIVREIDEPAGTGVAFLNVPLLAVDSVGIGRKLENLLVAFTPAQLDVYRLMQKQEHGMRVSVKLHEQEKAKQ
jgi:hypothetical protein